VEFVNFKIIFDEKKIQIEKKILMKLLSQIREKKNDIKKEIFKKEFF